MAGGKLTPRQKMINMMYLVLTAMLALNVSREVMDFLYDDMKSKEVSIETISNQNSSVYGAFTAAANENEKKAGKWRDKAFEVKKRSEALYSKIDAVKKKLVMDAGGYELDENGKETDRPKKMDNREKSAEYFIVQGNGKNGKEFKAEIEAHKAFLLDEVNSTEGDHADLISSINKLFSTEDHVNKDGVKEPWVNHNFEHYPLISVLSTLTTIQSNIKNSEAQVIDMLQDNIDAGTIKFTGFRAMVQPKSNYVLQGETYTADVFLAAYDETQEPTIIVNDVELTADQIESGMGKLSFPTNALGEQTFGGKIIVTQGGNPITADFTSTYTVAPPSVVISPTKMNVLYRNVENPLDISVPGVDNSKVSASGPGLRKSGNAYVADVTKVKGKEITINVSITKEDGSTKAMGSQKFRIKGLPKAAGMIYKKTEGILSKGALSKGTVEAAYEDFPFELPLTVTGFEVNIEGFAPATVKGNKFDSTTKKRIEKLKPGSTVTIRKIKAKTKRGDRVSKIGSISIDVN